MLIFNGQYEYAQFRISFEGRHSLRVRAVNARIPDAYHHCHHQLTANGPSDGPMVDQQDLVEYVMTLFKSCVKNVLYILDRL